MITLISGTNRRASNTRRVVARLEQIYTELGAPPAVVDLVDLPGELFSPDAYEERPRTFAPLAAKVVNAQGLAVVLPEYNGGFPGALKLFIDHLPFPESFEGRPVSFVGVSAGMFGALRPVEQTAAVFSYRNAYIYPTRVFIPNCQEVIDEATGRILSAAIDRRLREQAAGFLDFVGRLTGRSTAVWNEEPELLGAG